MKSKKEQIEQYHQADIIEDLPDEVSEQPRLQEISDIEIPEALKDPVEYNELKHRIFEKRPFWQKIPEFSKVAEEEFLTMEFQNKNTATKVDHLDELLEGLVSEEFLGDVRQGMHLAPMNLRLSPYILSLINWDDPYNDPLRTQFIPVASTRRPDHPKLSLDSLSEQEDSPTPGLVHRYFDKVLFLALDVCPVYCRFCTRSYAIGSDTDLVTKLSFKPVPRKWNEAFAYIASRPEVEDVVISGGDSYMLKAHRITQIGKTLLDIPHVRRIRFASKGPSVMPMKIVSDDGWSEALIEVVKHGQKKGKEVALHTHFNHSNEITYVTKQAMDKLFTNGVRVRNQSVLIRGVNDSMEDMVNLVRQLAYINVQPYYVYQHDMVKGTEELRTALKDSIELERNVRGTTAGFNTPTFVMDAPGGGGKRDLHSYEYYDEETGVSVYRSPAVDEKKIYLYFDPIDSLPKSGQVRWKIPREGDKIIEEAIKKSGHSDCRSRNQPNSSRY
ncbi:MAG: KamA family radical SAM protein [Fidelibacterota bacterium]